MSNICKKVTLIHRRDKLRAEKILQDRMFEKKNIEVIWNSELKKVIGDLKQKTINKVLIKNTKDKKDEELLLDGLFIAIGHQPATEVFLKKQKLIVMDI